MQGSIRRGKKRKLTRALKDDEQLASDKLFEISYYCQEKFEDQSKMLFDDTHRDTLRNKTNERAEKTQSKNNCYRSRPKSREPKLNLKEYRTIRMTQITQQFDKTQSKLSETVQNIFNTLQSKQVFVGLKKQGGSHLEHSNPQFQSYIEFKPKRRIETMPVIQKNAQLTTIRTHAQEFKHQTIDSRLAYKIRCLFGREHFLNGSVRKKESQQMFQNKKMLKQKVRRDIFGISQRKSDLSLL